MLRSQAATSVPLCNITNISVAHKRLLVREDVGIKIKKDIHIYILMYRFILKFALNCWNQIG